MNLTLASLADYFEASPYLLRALAPFEWIWAIIVGLLGLLFAWLWFCRPFRTRLEDCRNAYHSLEGEHKAQLDRTAQLRGRLIDEEREKKYAALQGQMDADLRRRDEELEGINLRYNSLQTDLGSRDEELATLRLSSEKVQEDLERRNADFEARNSEFDKLRLDLDSRAAEIADRDNELEELRLKLTGLEKEKHDEVSKFDGLLGELRSSLSAKDEEVSGLGLKLGGFEKDLGNRDAELKALRLKVSNLENEKQEESSKLGELRSSLTAKEEEINDLGLKLGSIESDLGDRDAELEALRHKVSSLENEKQEESSKYDGLLGELRSSLTAKEEEVNGLGLKLGGFEKDLGDRQGEIDSLHGRIGELEDEGNQLRSKVTARDEDISGLNIRIGELEGQNADLHSKIDANGGEMESLHDQLGELAHLKARYAEAQDAISKREDELAALRAELETNSNRIGELDGLPDELATLRTQLDESHLAHESKDSDLEKLRLEVDSLNSAKKEEVGNLQLRINELMGIRGDLESERGELQVTVEQLEGAVASKQGNLDELNVRIGDLEAQLVERDAELGELRDEASGAKSGIESKAAELAVLTTSFAALKASKSDDEKSISSIRGDLDAKDKELSEIQGKFKDLRAQLDAAKAAQAEADKAAAAAKEAAQNAEKRAKTAVVDLDKANAANAKISEQLGKFQDESNTHRLNLKHRDEELAKAHTLAADRERTIGEQSSKVLELEGKLKLAKENASNKATAAEQASNQLKALQKETETLTKDRDGLRVRFEKLEAQHADAENRATAGAKVSADLKSQLAALEKENANLSKDRDGLGQRFAKLEAQLADTESRFTAESKGSADLKSQLAAVQKEKDGLAKDREGLSQRSAKLEAQLADTESRFTAESKGSADLKSQLAAVQKERDGLAKDREGLSQRSAKLEAQLAETQNRFTTESKGSADLKSQLATLQKDNANLSKDREGLSQRSAKLEAQLAETQSRFTAESKSSADLKSQLAAVQKEKDGLAKDREGLSQRSTKLEAQLAETQSRFTAESKSSADLKSQLAALQNEKDGLAKDRDGIKMSFGKLEGNLRDAENRFSAESKGSADLKSQLAALLKERDGLRTDRDGLNSRVGKLEGDLKAAAGQQSDIKKLQAEIAALKADRDSLSGKATKLNAQVGDATAKATASSQDASALRRELAALKKERDGLAGQIDGLSGDADQLAATKKDLADTRRIAKAGETEILELKAQLKGAESAAVQAKELAAKAKAIPKPQPKPKPVPKVKPAPVPVAKKLEAKVESGQKIDPKLGLLYTSRPKQVDDLKKISGVASVLEKRLNDFGVYRFKQVADWDQPNVDEFSERIGFKGRVERDRWIPQCQRLYEAKYLSKIDPKLGLLYTKQLASPDDLTQIPGISADQAAALNSAGVYRFEQIADWDDKQWSAWKAKLKLPANAKYEDWILGARKQSELAKGNSRFKVPEGTSYDPSLGFVFKKKPKAQDDLKQISGVGAILEGKLQQDGVYRFEQIANWNQRHVDNFNDRLSFKGRIERDSWIMQARRLHEGESLRKKDKDLGVVYTEEPTDFDNLTEIRGVDHKIENGLNGLGVYQFDQIADWDARNAAAAAKRLGIKDDAATAGWANDAGAQFDSKYSTSVDDELGTVYSRRPKQVDDLKEIKGVAHVLEGRLHDFGVYRFDQIANWTPAQVQAFSEKIGFKDRVERDDWIPQARRLHEARYLTVRDAKFGTLFTEKPSSADKLTDIDGIDAGLAKKLNDAGIYRYEQIAAWDATQWKAWTGRLGFKGNYDAWLLDARLRHESKYGNGKFVVIEGAKYDSKHGFYFEKKPAEIDDLKKISGVANVLEKALHKHGVYRFQQIAQWSDHQASEFGDDLAFPGRVQRDQWILQARRHHEWKYLTQQDTELGVVYTEAPTHPDELDSINGLTSAHEVKLNKAGVYTFDQFITWDDATAGNIAKQAGVSAKVMEGWRNAASDEWDLKYNATIDEKLGLLFARRPRRVDDLKKIYGVAKILEKELHDFGVYWFSQISNWSDPVVDEFAQRLTFKDRVYRDDWIGQCGTLKDNPEAKVGPKKKKKK